MKLNIPAFAVAFGLWWGVGLFIATWWLMIVGYAPVEPTIIEGVYPGFGFTPVGSLIGLAWGLACGTICGGILALLYNVLADRIGQIESAPLGGTT